MSFDAGKAPCPYSPPLFARVEFDHRMPRYRVTVDTGGTFSDFVYLNEETGEVSITKVPSTPDDPSRAILAGHRSAARPGRARGRHRLFLPRHHRRHQRAARRQGRQDRPAGDRRLPRHLPGRPSRRGPTAPRSSTSCTTSRRCWCRRAAPARSRSGSISAATVLRAARRGGAARRPCASSQAQNIESIAVCLLFSFLHPRARGARARDRRARRCPACSISLSSEILPQIREYYRLSTTVINAYLQPILARYIAQLDQPAHRRRHRHAAEIHHAVERRHGDVRSRRAHAR